MLLRDLVARISFKANTEQLRGIDMQIGSLKKGLVMAGSALVSTAALRRGGWLEELDLQLKALSGGGSNLDKFKKAIDELPAIFSRREAMEGFIGTLQTFGKLGGTFTAESVLQVLRMSMLLSARAKDDLDVLMPKLAGFIQSGAGMPQFLRSMGLFTDEAAKAWNKLVARVQEGAGVMSPEILTELGKFFTKFVEENGETLQKELEERSSLTVLQVQKEWEDLWNTISRKGVEALSPLIKFTANMLRHTEQMASEFGGVKQIVQNIVDYVEGFLTAPLEKASVGMLLGSLLGLRFGGIKGMIAGGLGGGMLEQKMWEDFKRDPESIPMPLRKALEGFQYMGELLKSMPVPEMFLPPHLQGRGKREEDDLKPLRLREVPVEGTPQSSLNINGDLNVQISVPAGMDVQTVGKVLVDELIRVGNDHLGNLEVAQEAG